MSDLFDEVNAIISQLPKHQQEALKGLFDDAGQPPAPVKKRGIPPKDKVHNCQVVLVCRLCGTRGVHVFKSSSPLPSEMPVNTCFFCKTVLSEKTVEELVEIAIRNACSCTAELKDLKKAADDWYAKPKQEEIKDEHDTA